MDLVLVVTERQNTPKIAFFTVDLDPFITSSYYKNTTRWELFSFSIYCIEKRRRSYIM
jgi:hypothetical protein